MNLAGLTFVCLAWALLGSQAQAKPVAAKSRPAPADVIQDCADCPQMIPLPAGRFVMGSPPSEMFRGAETQHPVTIPAFAVSRFEITFAQWDACVAGGGCNGYRPDSEGRGRGRRPVVQVNWADGQAYAAWLTRKTGHHYRLLSESEWEYAARAGAPGDAPFAFGRTLTAAQANFDASSKTALNPAGIKRGRALPVGSFAPNAFGLYDMHGNVWEWVEDCWNDEYGPKTPDDGSAASGDCNGHVLRGGSYEDYVGDVRAAARVANSAEERTPTDGLRLARDL